MVPTGTVKWYDPEKGYGFVARDDGEANLFVHRSEARYEVLNKGDRVDFEVGYGAKGANAVGLRITEGSTLPPRTPSAAFGSGRYGNNRSSGANTSQPYAGARPTNVADLPFIHGVIRRYDPLRGIGFIRPDTGGDDVFVHRSAFNATVPAEGQRVGFRLGRSPKGPRAESVQLVNDTGDDTGVDLVTVPS